MAQYRDSLPAQQSWIHELARAEIHPDAEQVLQLGKAFDPQQLIEESTIQFLTELREQFVEMGKVFNSYSESGSRFQDVKIYSLAQTPADFMVFRNGVKLVVSNTAHGVIQVSFAKHARGTFSVDGQLASTPDEHAPSSLSQGQEMVAQMGPFREVLWTFQGEKISPDQVAKFYFSEFIRATRDSKRSKSGNQALLEQIKNLLTEKGLNL